MKVRELLAKKKDNHVALIEGGKTVLDAARMMNEHRIGCLVVVADEGVAGIFSERDVLRRVVAERRDPAEVLVREVMTEPVIIVHPDESLEDCQAIITQKRIRHLPVVEGDRIVGMITPGDIMAQSVHDHKVEIEYLQSYLHGFG